MAQSITLQGATYQDVPAVDLPKTGGGTARFTDTSPTTATDPDVTQGKIYFKANGEQSVGTGSGGGVDPDNLAIMVSPSSATGSAVTGDAVTEAPNYIPGGDITAPELDYEFKDGKLYIYGIKRPLFIGSGVKLIISQGLTSNVVGVGAADYMRI